jgi:Na+/proline symporter
LGPWGLIIFPFYLVVIVLISWVSRRRWQTANDYLNASRSLPTWAAALSLLAYNCGSIEVIGMSAMAAQYGVQALHFYWVGGIPGMIFLGIVVLPVYMRTGARSLPQYLGMRFGTRVRLLNAGISMAGAAGFAGVAIYALAQVLHVLLGWNLPVGALISASLVLVYVLVGGLRATIFTSVFQLFVMIAGLTPLFFLTVHFTAATFAQRPDRWHLWRPLPLVNPNASLDCIGVAFGLGFVISFSYWCTDFVLIQRALTARTVEAARKVPLLAGFGKLAFGPLIVLPGVAAPALLRGTHWLSFDESIPALMSLTYGPTLLAVGTSALLASLMAGLAGNVSGFSALWTEEIYRTCLRPDRSEQHYICACVRCCAGRFIQQENHGTKRSCGDSPWSLLCVCIAGGHLDETHPFRQPNDLELLRCHVELRGDDADLRLLPGAAQREKGRRIAGTGVRQKHVACRWPYTGIGSAERDPAGLLSAAEHPVVVVFSLAGFNRLFELFVQRQQAWPGASAILAPQRVESFSRRIGRLSHDKARFHPNRIQRPPDFFFTQLL